MKWPPPADWPHAELSRQVLCPPHRWHIQETGSCDTVLLLHGAGGSTHSFRAIIPRLAEQYHVVAVDLPGQGFTQAGARHRCGLDHVAEDLSALCRQENWSPVAIVGHSAGGALALRMSQLLVSPRGQPPVVIGINAALDTFQGLAGVLFPVLARMLAAIPFTARIFSAASSSPQRVEALIRSTGSELDTEGLALYQRLVSDRDHADATLLMMAQWSLDRLLKELETITSPVHLIVGDNDKTVPPHVSERSVKRLTDARLSRITGAGHLAHEERPDDVADLILNTLASQSLS